MVYSKFDDCVGNSVSLGKYQIVEKSNKKTGRKWYILTINYIAFFTSDISTTVPWDTITRHFDPSGQRMVGKNEYWFTETSYKFKHKKDAEELISIAVLKGWL